MKFISTISSTGRGENQLYINFKFVNDFMRSGFVFFLILSSVLIIHFPIPQSSAWGYDVHEEIVSQVIDLLPDPWRDQLKEYEVEIKQASINPDRRKSSDPAEGSRHYDDQDEPHQDRNVTYPSRDWDLGVVGWAAENASRDLTNAMGQNDFHSIIRYLGDTVHYISDAAQPLHATKNYDGQLTGNHGIHSRFETNVVLRNFDEVFDLSNYSSLILVDDVYNLTESQILSGLELVPTILEADNHALNLSTTYNDLYYESLYNNTKGIIKDRLKLAIYNSASVWYTSIIQTNWTEFILPPPDSEMSTPGNQGSDNSVTNDSFFPFLSLYTMIIFVLIIRKKVYS